MKKRSPLEETLEHFRDLGVKELYLSPRGRGAASAPEAGARPKAPATPASAPLVAPKSPDVPRWATLGEMAAEVAGCERCRLCKTRKKTVFADGSPSARLMFVGEAPGADEDAQGVPFVGRAGQLLTKMIESGMGLDRAKDVYIANVLKCRPPENRNPEPDEVVQCRRYLEAQIDLVKPEVIVGLGKFAVYFLLQTEEGITRIRGRWGVYRGIPVMPTYHPSFLLRQPDRKKEAWQDLLGVLERLGLPAPGR